MTRSRRAIISKNLGKGETMLQLRKLLCLFLTMLLLAQPVLAEEAVTEEADL